MNKLFAVVLHFGDSITTNDCISSILRKEKNIYRIIVIDNGRNFILSKGNNSAKIKVIVSKENLGFSKGVNIGIKYALLNKASHILLLNNDTKVERSFINSLFDILNQNSSLGIISPAIKFKRNDKSVYDIGGKINNLFGRTSHNEIRIVPNKKYLLTDYVSGCAMLIKKEVFERIGFFDERFFLYYEDTDFCIRARNYGFEVAVVPSVYIEHELSKTAGKFSDFAIYHQTRSAIEFGKKYYRNMRIFNLAFIFIQSLYVFIKNPKIGRFAFLAIYQNI